MAALHRLAVLAYCLRRCALPYRFLSHALLFLDDGKHGIPDGLEHGDGLEGPDDEAVHAAREGALVRVESRNSDELHAGRGYDLAALFHEQSISTNTAAAGGNAQLMTMA